MSLTRLLKPLDTEEGHFHECCSKQVGQRDEPLQLHEKRDGRGLESHRSGGVRQQHGDASSGESEGDALGPS